MAVCGVFFFPVGEFCVVTLFVRVAMILFRQKVVTTSVIELMTDHRQLTRRVTLTQVLSLNMV